VAFLFSDFLARDYEQSLKVAHKRHDLIPVVTLDPLEEKLPEVGILYLEDAETGEMVVFDTSKRAVEAYRRRVLQLREWREAMFRRYKIDFINVWTNKPYLQSLVQFFRIRERRLRR
jgi:hypothetical protein